MSFVEIAVGNSFVVDDDVVVVNVVVAADAAVVDGTYCICL